MGMGSGSAPVPGQDGFGGDGDDGMPERDDDDLEAMQAEPMVTSYCHCTLQCANITARARQSLTSALCQKAITVLLAYSPQALTVSPVQLAGETSHEIGKNSELAVYMHVPSCMSSLGC